MRCSKQDLAVFLSSSVWADIKEIINGRIDKVKDDLLLYDKEVDVFKDMREVSYNRGRIEELRFLLLLPEFLFNQFDLLKEEEEGD